MENEELERIKKSNRGTGEMDCKKEKEEGDEEKPRGSGYIKDGREEKNEREESGRKRKYNYHTQTCNAAQRYNKKKWVKRLSMSKVKEGKGGVGHGGRREGR